MHISEFGASEATVNDPSLTEKSGLAMTDVLQTPNPRDPVVPHQSLMRFCSAAKCKGKQNSQDKGDQRGQEAELAEMFDDEGL